MQKYLSSSIIVFLTYAGYIILSSSFVAYSMDVSDDLLKNTSCILMHTLQTQFDHPHLHIRRVREFRFREVLKPARERDSRASSTGPDRDDLSSSVDNLVQVS